MDVARVMASRSTCSRASVGAVIAQDTRVVATGYNGAPAGLPHCDHECDCGTPEHIDGYCASLQPCAVAVHAEANAIAFAAKHGVVTDRATLYVTLSPCLSCARLIINAGITDVVYGEQYRNVSGLDLLRSAGVRVSQGTGTR